MRSLRRRWKSVFPLLLAGLCHLPTATLLADEAGRMPAFRTATVTCGDLVATIGATGTLEPEEVVDIGAQVAGRIVSLGADPRANGKSIDFGSLVEKGELLARIDDAPYAAQLDQARAALMRAKADLAKATAELELATIQSKRAAEQLKNKSISTGDFDVAAVNLKLAQAAVAVVEASVAQGQAGIKQAEINLGYTMILSPVKGVIIARRVNVGQTVAASLNAPSLFLIATDLAKMQVWASVNEADVGRIRAGQSVRFTVDAYPRDTFSGKVEQVRLDAQMMQNVVTYTVVVATDNAGGKLLPYLTASLQFEVERNKDVLLVPNAALLWRPRPEQIAPDARDKLAPTRQRTRADDDHGQLWVRDGNFVRPIDVRLGPTDGMKTEVGGSGVEEGMEVIIGEKVEAKEIGRTSKTTQKEAMRQTLDSMGTNLLLVMPGAVGGKVTWGFGSTSTLTPQDAEEIARQCPAVSDVAPVVRGRSQITYGNRNWVAGNIMGTTPSFLATRDWEELSEGEMFTDRDVRCAAKVCLVGETVERELFVGESPVGKEIRIRNIPFRVLGVLSRKGANIMGLDQDDIVLSPWTAIKYYVDSTATGAVETTAANRASKQVEGTTPLRPNPAAMDQIFVKAISEEQIPQATEQLTELLRQRHRIGPGQADDFNVRDMTELKKTMLALPPLPPR